MRTKLSVLLILSVPFLFLTCNQEPKNETAVDPNGCQYSYDPGVTELKWTAFKFTEKVGVGGTFGNIKVDSLEKAPSVAAAVNGMKFKIDTGSVNSNHEERDGRIRSFFFGNMTDGTEIRGSIQGIGSEATGEAKLNLTINGNTSAVPVQYKVMNGNEVEIWGKLNMTSWKTEKSLDALNEACYDLHKGEDGISKLWPEVEVRAYTRLKKDCP